MNCLVTGAGGLIGSFLVERLAQEKHSVLAMVHEHAGNLDAVRDRLTIRSGRIEEAEAVRQVVTESCPQRIYHLAAQSFPEISWREPSRTFETNVMGLVHLLEAVRTVAPDALVVVIGSSSEYAPSTDGSPISEQSPLGPSSPYAVSKLAQIEIARLYGNKYNLRIIRVRPFFLIGPRKTGDVISDFARKIVEVERGQRTVLPVGNLDVVRDFLDVRDGVTGLQMLAEKGEAGEIYNLCFGKGVRLREVLDGFKSLARVTVREQTDPTLIRPIDELIKVGNPSKLMKLGWKPEIPLRQTLADTLEYWRQQALVEKSKSG